LEETSVNDTRAVSNPTKTRKRNGNTRNQDKGEEKKRRGKKELQLRERERERAVIMNLFRLLGDMTHLLSIVVLLLKIRTMKSCAGILCMLYMFQLNFLFLPSHLLEFVRG